MAEKTLQPKLRFPGFEGEWEEKKLREVSDILSGKRIPKGMTFSSQKTNRRYITVSDMGDLYVNPANLQYIDENVEKQIYKYKVLENDLIISVAGTIGKINIIDKLVSGENLTENCNRLTNFRDIHYKYLYYTMIGDTFQSIVNSTKTVGTQPKLALTRIRDFTAFFPSFQEQQKIASFLTTVDKRITLLTQKKEKLEQYKKGVMQKIFNREIRFKDENGNDFPEWEEKRLEEMCSFFSGGTPSVGVKKYYGGKIPFIKSGEIFLSNTEQTITEEGLSSSSSKMVDIGDILYALYGATSGCVALSKIKGAINQAILCIRPHSDMNFFIKELLLYNKEQILGKYLQGGQGNLSAEIIKKLKFFMPSLPEQQKIASFLSAIDQQIEHVGKQINGMKEWKKGLLQQLFV